MSQKLKTFTGKKAQKYCCFTLFILHISIDWLEVASVKTRIKEAQPTCAITSGLLLTFLDFYFIFWGDCGSL